MTPDIEMLKKIQHLFEGWNVGDRYYDTEYEQIGFVTAVPDSNHKHYEGTLESGLHLIYMKSFDVCYHYPYPHQLWEKVNWSRFAIETTGNGNVLIYDCGDEYGDTDNAFYTGDLETALLKALVWQMEERK